MHEEKQMGKNAKLNKPAELVIVMLSKLVSMQRCK